MSNIYLKPESFIVIISAPSGCGKTSISSALIEQNKNLKKSISLTTREKRKNEIDGVDYYFINLDKFNQLIQEGKILEYTEMYGNYYGTLLDQTIENLNNNYNLIFDICTNGASKIKNFFPLNSISIFLLPPSIEELKNRLLKRDSNSFDDISHRISKAESEIQNSKKFDFVVINDDFNKCLLQITSILKSKNII